MGQINCKQCSLGTFVSKERRPGIRATDCWACPYGRNHHRQYHFLTWRQRHRHHLTISKNTLFLTIAITFSLLWPAVRAITQLFYSSMYHRHRNNLPFLTKLTLINSMLITTLVSTFWAFNKSNCWRESNFYLLTKRNCLFCCCTQVKDKLIKLGKCN